MSPWTLFVILAAGIAAYSNGFTGAFLFDDRRFILSSVLQAAGDVARVRSLAEILTGPRPFLHLTFTLNYLLGGLNPWGYHLVNLLIHLLAGLTLFGILRRTFLNINFPLPFGERIKVRGKGPDPHPNPLPERERGIRGDAFGLAFTIALLWLLHPLQTQSVTYIIQRGESLMGLFYLLTLYSVIRSNIPSPQPSPFGGEGKMKGRVRGWPLVAVFSCALGMSTKEVMVTAPLLTLLYDRVFLSSSFKEIFQKRKFLYLGLFATGILVVRQILWIFHPSEMNHRTAGFGVPNLTPFNYALTQTEVILYYLKLCFWPHPLVIDYQWPTAQSLNEALFPVLIISILLFMILASFKWRPEFGFLGVWFFLILAPTSSFIPIADLAFEHRMYLPLASVITLAVLMGHRLLQKQPLLAKSAVFILTTTLGTLTFLRNQDYQSEVTIWQDTVEKRPGNWRAYGNLGTALLNKGRPEEARLTYQEALRINPNYVLVHYNIATILDAQGKLDEAVQHYEEALRIDPSYADAHSNLGTILAQRGRLEEAIFHYLKTLEFNPIFAEGYYNLGNAYLKQGRVTEAVTQYSKALQLKPEFIPAQQQLKIALTRQKELEGSN